MISGVRILCFQANTSGVSPFKKCRSAEFEGAPAVIKMAVPLFALMSSSIGGARIGAAAGACAASAGGQQCRVCSAADLGELIHCSMSSKTAITVGHAGTSSGNC